MTSWDPQSGPYGQGETPPGGPPPPPPPPPPPASPPTPPVQPPVQPPMQPPMQPPGGPTGYGAQPPTGGTGGDSNGAATASLILGILSWLCLGPLGAIPAIITGVIGRKKTVNRGMATAGLWLGIVNLVISIIGLIALIGLSIGGVLFVAEGTKVVDPKYYSVSITDCSVSSGGYPSATVDITNLDSKKRNFDVSVEFSSTQTSQTIIDNVVIRNVEPDETKSGEFSSLMSFSSRVTTGKCRVKEVRNYFS